MELEQLETSGFLHRDLLNFAFNAIIFVYCFFQVIYTKIANEIKNYFPL